MNPRTLFARKPDIRTLTESLHFRGLIVALSHSSRDVREAAAAALAELVPKMDEIPIAKLVEYGLGPFVVLMAELMDEGTWEGMRHDPNRWKALFLDNRWWFL
ncbi:MAG: hypothetical protein QHJ34_09510 [bacterium]|jgi:hypothetical protein|nr:hypothetical protein [candidate division KSB1 bacterium]MDH7560453.1 hypothetical protein [bacterium]